ALEREAGAEMEGREGHAPILAARGDDPAFHRLYARRQPEVAPPALPAPRRLRRADDRIQRVAAGILNQLLPQLLRHFNGKRANDGLPRLSPFGSLLGPG